MDKQILKTKLKKYLFFISIVFLTLTGIHLIYSFIYFDSKEVPQKGGTISESFVGNFPNLNPLKYNNDHNSYINNILYRSLLSYDIINNKIIGDLATCNIENTKNIKCNLKANIKWSSGDNITSEDIFTTYNTIEKHNTNPVIKSILDNIKITHSDTSILFESNISDVNILNILFQPILPKSVIEKTKIENLAKNISPIGGVYSGKYKITKIDQDETVGFKKIFLEKNSFYIENSKNPTNPVYINNILLKFYKDYPSLLQQKDSINIFNDKKNLIGDSIPKLKNHKYILPQYVGVFINKDKLEYPNIRKYILSEINSKKIIETIGEKNNKLIKSPFLNEIELNIKRGNTTLKTMLNSLGYYNKNYYLSKIGDSVKKETKKISDEVKIEKTNIGIELQSDKLEINITEIKNSITKDNYNSSSKIISSPSWIDKYNFITNPNITLEGISSKNVSEVYINDYKLKNYKPETEKFFYKLSQNIGNIKTGENNYKIFFIENGKKILKEKITIFYNKSKQTLAKNEIDLIAQLVNEKINKIKKDSENKTEKEKIVNKKEETVINNKLNSEQIKKQNLIKALNNNYYYDKNFKPYTLSLSYINGSKQIQQTATEIQSQLQNSGIKIEVTPIKNGDLQKQIKENKEEYNILITGINLGYFNFNISKYFYSGQISSGKNISKIKNSDLDNILEELKSGSLKKEDILKAEKRIIKIFESENIFKPLYSPYYSNLVLKNIQGYKLSDSIPNDSYRFEPLIKSYILKEKIINSEGKSIFGFIKYLINNLF